MNYLEKLQKERSKIVTKQKPFLAANKEDQLIANEAHNVHKLKAKDSTGRWAYYFIYVKPQMEKVFLRDLNLDKTIDLERYGRVIASNYGEQPNEQVLQELRDRYGWTLDEFSEDIE